MKLLSQRTLCGPNIYHHKPVVLTRVDIGKYKDIASNEIPGFIEKLCAQFPGIQEHTCSLGYRGGFVERLHRGTYMAHIIEHIAIELSLLSKMEGHYGKTRFAGIDGQYNIVTRFQNEEGMKACHRFAFEWAHKVLNNEDFNLEKALQEITLLIEKTALGPTGEALVQAAERKRIPYKRLNQDSLIRLGYGKNIRFVQAAVTDKTSLISVELVQDKALTKKLLDENWIPVPQGTVVTSIEELKEEVKAMKAPFVVKPLNAHHGNGVALNLKNFSEAKKAFERAKVFGPEVILEEMCEGKDYRVLVVGGKFVAAAERRPPSVTGDGKSTIAALIEMTNRDPRRGEGHGKNLTKIPVDDTTLETLEEQGFDLESILPKGKLVLLRPNANLSSGGDSVDVTDLVPSETRTLCERIARITGLDICGIDIIHENISLPVGEKFKVIEVNAGPGLRMHLTPTEGRPRPVADHIMDMLYPPGMSSRIPIVSVTGTNGKTTVVRMLSKILSEKKDALIGTTTTDGIWIGSEKIVSGDTTGPQSSSLVLSDSAVTHAVLEVARGGMLRGGLSYDWSDVSVVTNIRADHLGQDGIESLEDIVSIKALVAERVKEGGTLVLNADDVESLKLRDRDSVKKIKKNIFLYSAHDLNSSIREHVLRGGSAAWQQGGWLLISHEGKTHRLLPVAEIPAALGGLAMIQISNALAAAAAAFSMGATPYEIAEGLRAFFPSTENLGRLNLYKVGNGFVFIDYGHNPDAIESVGQMIQQAEGYQKIALVGLPGDRSTELIADSASRLPQFFDRIVLRDDYDLRGRKPGEVPEIMLKSIQMSAAQVPCKIILDEKTALKELLEDLKENQILVVFYDELQTIMPIIREYDPVPRLSLPALDDSQEIDLPLANRKDNVVIPFPLRMH